MVLTPNERIAVDLVYESYIDLRNSSDPLPPRVRLIQEIRDLAGVGLLRAKQIYDDALDDPLYDFPRR